MKNIRVPAPRGKSSGRSAWSDVSEVLRASLLAAVVVCFCAAFCAVAAFGANTDGADTCSKLKGAFSRSNTTISSVEVVPAGTFVPANPHVTGLDTETPPVTGLPTFCRVIGVLTPSSDSHIGIEVWMPISGWNGRLESIANHESGGIYYYGDMGAELKKNFAVASTDTGHTGTTDVNWAVGHPEKIVDYSWRAVHEMTLAAKDLIAAFYGSAPRFSYYNGCSTGGRQTLKEAQQFPNDYDGIISGSGFHYWTHQTFANLWKTQVMLKDGVNGASYLPPSKYKLVMNSAMDHCSWLKQASTDSFLGNPGLCDWNPKTLVCAAGQNPETCITDAQAVALEKIYEPLRNPRTNEELYPGATRISEPSWAEAALRRLNADGTSVSPPSLSSIVMSKTNFDWRTVNFDADVAFADERDASGPRIDAINPDLSKFQQHGGKIIEYQGWLDANNLTPYSIEHYTNVERNEKQRSSSTDEKAVEETQGFYRLFLVPGMGHCRGGSGPNAFGAETHPAVPADSEHNIVSAVQDWVEHGNAPKQIIATKYVNDDPKLGIVMQRPLCPYPQEAQYKGTGSTADATNFACVVRTKNEKHSSAGLAGE